jgi:hypothetical protein
MTNNRFVNKELNNDSMYVSVFEAMNAIKTGNVACWNKLIMLPARTRADTLMSTFKNAPGVDIGYGYRTALDVNEIVKTIESTYAQLEKEYQSAYIPSILDGMFSLTMADGFIVDKHQLFADDKLAEVERVISVSKMVMLLVQPTLTMDEIDRDFDKAIKKTCEFNKVTAQMFAHAVPIDSSYDEERRLSKLLLDTDEINVLNAQIFYHIAAPVSK